MVHVAQEMERQGFDDPAADRRRDHQPPAHGGEDRARSSARARCTCSTRRARCGVVVEPARRRAAARRSIARTAPSRPSCASCTRRSAPSRWCRCARRRANRAPIEWRAEDLAVPLHRRARRRRSPLDELVPYIDWTFFFTAWELKGRFPGILEHPAAGRGGARSVRQRARSCLRGIVDEQAVCTARGVYGFWPAHGDGDDIVLYTDEIAPARAPALPHAAPAATEGRRRAGGAAAPVAWPTSWRRPARACATVCATTSARSPSPPVSAPPSWRASSKGKLDDYSAIIVKALADRLAEAFAESLHAARSPRLGLRRGRNSVQRRSHRREVPRHPAGVRLSRLPRPHGEGQAVRAARRAVGRHHADRALRDDRRRRA